MRRQPPDEWRDHLKNRNAVPTIVEILWHGRYVGSDPKLAGTTALLREQVHVPKVLAQFDQLKATPMAFGWHEFPASDFEMVEPEHDEHTLEPWAEEALDQLDAGFFSGDCFHSNEAMARARHYMARWERKMKDISEMLAEEERDADEESNSVRP
jgi:hypothetical protein